MNDIILLKLLKESPNEGIEELMKRYTGLIYSIVKNRISEVCVSTDIEDCVADVFSEFYLGIDNYDPARSDIKSYLCSIANNKATDIFRKYKNRLWQISIDDESCIQLSDGETIENGIVNRETRKEIIESILAMEEPDRSILIRKYYFGETAKQIGEALGITEQNVNTRAHRAIKRIKDFLGGERK